MSWGHAMRALTLGNISCEESWNPLATLGFTMPSKTVAWCDWAAGLIIGLMPLAAHVLLHVAAKPTPDWDDNWSADLLFISISNSGLSAITVFARLIGGTYRLDRMTPRMRIVWALTLACFCLASLLYGAAVTGRGTQYTSITALLFLVFSAICSLNFELALTSSGIADGAAR